MLLAIRDAALEVCGDRLVFHFAAHPGEKPQLGEETVYQWALSAREDILREKPLNFLDTEITRLTPPQRVAVSDLTVFGGGGPTESIAAAYARKVTAYWNVQVQNVLGAQVAKAESWFVTALGGTYPLESADPQKLQVDLQYLLSEEGKDALRERQKQHFTPPDHWDNREAIIEYIENLIGRT
jgi:hypothetical protein